MVVASNSVDTAKVWLAIATLGGIFSSSSTDMGVNGVLQRALQVTPRYIFMDDFAIYNGKKVDLRQKMSEIAIGMKGVKEFEGMVSINRFPQAVDISQVSRTESLANYLTKSSTIAPKFEEMAFNDPFYIAYSSGTTGTPKCIVHGIGGCLLSAYKEARLHRELGPASVVLQYTTTGWIMYHFTIVSLLQGSKVILYDGSPFLPDIMTFIKLIGDQKVTMFGTSPRWMSEVQKNGIKPKEVTDLSSLRVVTSTGMVLSDKQFEWFYDVGFPKNVHLANISGGTDIVSLIGPSTLARL